MAKEKTPTLEIKTSIDVDLTDQDGSRMLVLAISKILGAGGRVRITVESVKEDKDGRC